MFCSVTVHGDQLLFLQPGYRFFKPGGLFGIKQSEEPYTEGQQMQEESKILVSPCAGRCSACPSGGCGSSGKLALARDVPLVGKGHFGAACSHFGPVNGKFLLSWLLPAPLSASQGWSGLWEGFCSFRVL